MKDALSLLRNKKPFSVYLIGSVISSFGSSLSALAIILYCTQTSVAKGLLAENFALQALPAIVLGPVAGYLVSKSNKKAIAVIGEFVKFVLMLLLFVFPGSVTILFSNLMINAVSLFSSPAIGVLQFQLLGDELYMVGRGIEKTATRLVKIVTPLVASALLIGFSVRTAFLVDAISYLISAGFLIAVQFPRDAEKSGGEGRKTRKFLESITAVFAEPDLLFFGIVSVFGSMAYVAAIDYIRRDLGFDESRYAIVAAFIAVGSIVGSVFLVNYGKKLKSHALFIFSCIVFALARLPLAFGVTFGISVVCVAMAINSASSNVFEVSFSSVLLASRNGSDRALSVSSANALQNLGNIIGYSVYGLLLGFLGNYGVILVSGAGILISVGLYYLVRMKIVVSRDARNGG